MANNGLWNIEVDGLLSREGKYLHVRYEGVSKDIDLNNLKIDFSTPDAQIKTATAEWLDLSKDVFEKFVVERHENGDMTIRPEAIFG